MLGVMLSAGYAMPIALFSCQQLKWHPADLHKIGPIVFWSGGPQSHKALPFLNHL